MINDNLVKSQFGQVTRARLEPQDWCKMATEIERKFLVNAALLPRLHNGLKVVQGYLSTSPEVRVRLIGEQDGQAYITVKGDGTISRDEYEVVISRQMGLDLLRLSVTNLISKFLYQFPTESDLTWEIDFYEDELTGLVTAEIELPTANHLIDKPNWIIQEITEDIRYKNKSLALHGIP